MEPQRLLTLSASWRFMRGTLRMTRRRPVVAAPLALGLVLGAVLFAAGLALAVVAYLRLGAFAALSTMSMVFPLLSLVGLVSRAVSIRLIEMELRGVEPALGRATRQTLRQWPSLLAVGISEMMIRRFARRVRRDRGVPFRGALGRLIELSGEVASYLIVPVIVIERRPLAHAIDRVHALHRGRYLSIGAGDRGLVVAPLLLCLAVWGASFLAGLAIHMLWPDATPWIVYGGCAAGTAFLLATAPLCRAAYYTTLYMWAVDCERGDRNKLPPPLLADALGMKN